MNPDLSRSDDDIRYSPAMHDRLMRHVRSATDVPVPQGDRAPRGQTMAGLAIAAALGLSTAFVLWPTGAPSATPPAGPVIAAFSVPLPGSPIATIDASIDSVLDESLGASIEDPARQVLAFLRERASEARALAVKPV